MKKLRVGVREVANVIYEIQVDDDFTALEDFDQVAEILWATGVAENLIQNEVVEEEIQDVWEK